METRLASRADLEGLVATAAADVPAAEMGPLQGAACPHLRFLPATDRSAPPSPWPSVQVYHMVGCAGLPMQPILTQRVCRVRARLPRTLPASETEGLMACTGCALCLQRKSGTAYLVRKGQRLQIHQLQAAPLAAGKPSPGADVAAQLQWLCRQLAANASWTKRLLASAPAGGGLALGACSSDGIACMHAFLMVLIGQAA